METANETTAAFGATVPPGIGGSIAGVPGGFSSSAIAGANSASESFGDSPRSIEVPLLQAPNNGGQFGVAVTGVAEAQDEGRLVYEPGHPLANASGYVIYPKIDTSMEMANLADAKRLYEANASVFQVTKSMLRAALDI